MRVAIVSPYDLAVPGGVQQHVDFLADALGRRGDDVLVVGPGPDPLPDSPVGAHLDRRAVGVSQGVPFNDSVAPLALLPMAARRTVTTLRQFAPDVVHVHEPVVPWVSLAATAWGPRPVVATFHAWSDHDRIYRATRPLAKRLLRRLGGMIAVSPAAADYHGSALGLPKGRIRLIPNGVQVARFRDAEPIAEHLDPSRPLVLFVGRLEERKGARDAIRAFVQLKTTRPRARMVVVGDGPQRAACEAAVPSGLRGDVTFVGRVPDTEVPRWFRTADLYLAPATGGESFGIVLLEAMAAGTPVIASDIPGYRTSVHDGRNGRLVPPGKPAEFARAAEELLANDRLRASLVTQASTEVERYDWDRVAREVREVYGRAVLQDHARRHGTPPPEAESSA